MFRTSSFLFVSLLALAACGGDGSGSIGTSDSSDAFTSFSDVPADGTVVINGQAVTASYTQDLATNTVNVGTVSDPSDSRIRFTNEGGDTVAIDIRADGSDVAFDTRTGDRVRVFGDTAVFSNESLSDTALIVDGPEAGFEYQSYGTWYTGVNTGSGTLGSGSYGATTTAAGIPNGTTANYRGKSIGQAQRADGLLYVTDSNIIVSTDFNTATISSANTVATPTATAGFAQSAPELDFSGTGPVTGSTFTAPIAGTGPSGTANGQFYGPSAEEVGGTFSASSPPGTGSQGIVYSGAFGAK